MTALTSEALSTHPRPALRIVPAPSSAPPYDDELGARRLHLVPLSAAVPAPGADAWSAAERTAATELPAAKAFAHSLIQAVLEVVAGVRSVKQLRRDTTADVYSAFADSLPGRSREAGDRPNARSVRTVHVQERPEGVAEVCATVVRGHRLVAVALRLEGRDGRWKCTDLVGV